MGLFDGNGKLLGSASSPIQIWKVGDCVEQSSTDIWHAICAAVKAACSLANVAGQEVTGLGFAATCSLVAVDSEGAPVTVSWSGDTRRNVIVWMDHRAVKQAERINSSNSTVLQYCGGALSPEMQPPKGFQKPSIAKEQRRQQQPLLHATLTATRSSCRGCPRSTRDDYDTLQPSCQTSDNIGNQKPIPSQSPTGNHHKPKKKTDLL
ncbi:unnamed protein product [Ilex paraguariensis]|uniref:FGGY carbohydrate kinase domain-containing protein n=1 Tax=Ilex paraguariensis TaxID=185542 RepID=A0ABC8SIF9_9AQUA